MSLYRRPPHRADAGPPFGWSPDWWITALFVVLAMTPFIGFAVRGYASEIEMGLAAVILTSCALGAYAHHRQRAR